MKGLEQEEETKEESKNLSATDEIAQKVQPEDDYEFEKLQKLIKEFKSAMN